MFGHCLRVLLPFILISCASKTITPLSPNSTLEKEFWNRQCAYRVDRSVEGELILRAQTPEFKGQFPAVLRVEKNGDFLLEITHILGGTLGQIVGKDQKIEIRSEKEPKQNKKNLDSYLGLPYSFWVPLLRGRLPCARIKELKGLEQQVWWTDEDQAFQKWEVKGLFTIEALDFDEGSGRLESGKVVTPSGELKWKWKEFQEL